MPYGYELVANSLAAHGINYVYGIVGVPVI